MNIRKMSVDMSQELRSLDRITRCKLCQEYITEACITDCGHTFCRACVTKTRGCQDCRVQLSEDGKLLQNFVVDELAEAVKSKMQAGRITENDWTIPEKQDDDPPFSFALPDEGAYLEDDIPKALHGISATLCCQICGGLYENAIVIKPCGHTLCSVCFRGHLQSNKTGKHRQRNACSVCKTEIEGNVDKHLVKNRPIQEAVFAFKQIVDSLQSRNDALSNEDASERSSRPSRRSAAQRTSLSGFGRPTGDGEDEEPIRTRFPPRNYGTMKLKELRDLCDKYHLQSKGTDTKLRERLKRFTVLWNAELDSIFPRTPTALAKRIDKEERAKSIEEAQSRFNGSNRQRTSTNNPASSTYDEGISQFNSETGNPDKFKEMIAVVKRRMKKEKQQAGSSHQPESKSDDPLSPSAIDSNASDSGENNVESPLVRGDADATVGSASSSRPNGNVEADAKASSVQEGSADQNAQMGRTQDDAIEIDDDDDNEPCSVDGARSQLADDTRGAEVSGSKSDSTNKENDSTTSPAGSQQPQVSLKLPAAEAKPVAMRNPHSISKQSGVSSTTIPSQNPASATDNSTTRTKRPSPTPKNSSTSNRSSSSDAKRCRSPWSCPRCTLENDTLNVCLACGLLR